MRNRQARLGIFAVAMAVLTAGCSPAPSDREAANYRETRFAVTPVDQHLEVDGCTVTVHRVTTRISDPINDFTLAVAKCPTATVTTVQQGCGRTCAANTILVEPAVPGAAPADVPAVPAPR